MPGPEGDISSPRTLSLPDALKKLNWEDEFDTDGISITEMFKTHNTSLTYKYGLFFPY